MPIDLIATFIVGAAAGLFTWLVYRARRRRMPRIMLPLAIGSAMIAFAVWSEYTWWWRTRDALPAGLEVIETIPQRSLFRPWTYVFPSVSRMVAVDRAAIRRNPRYPDLVLVDVVLLERWLPARRVVRLGDCAQARIADVTSAAAFTESGSLPPSGAWAPLRRDSTLFVAMCADPQDAELPSPPSR